MKYELISRGRREWMVRELTDDGKIQREVPRACTVADLLKTFPRSQRHLYRWLSQKRLPTVGKFFGQWLVDMEAVERILPLLSGSRRRLPAGCQWLFPEYQIHRLSPLTHATLITGRLLNQGGLRDVKWILRTYPRSWLIDFVKREGPRLLSPRALNFWSWWFRLPSRPTSWRTVGRKWGGIT